MAASGSPSGPLRGWPSAWDSAAGRGLPGPPSGGSWGAAVASWGASAVSAQEPRRKSDPAIPGGTLGIPGPYPGRVIEVRNPGLVHDGRRDRAAVRATLNRGLVALTGADHPVEA